MILMADSANVPNKSLSHAAAGMSIADASAFAIAHGLAADVQAIQNRQAHPRLRDKYNMFRKGHLLELLEKHRLLDGFIAERWPTGATKRGRRKRVAYRRRREKNDRLWEVDPQPDPGAVYPPESRIRDLLAQNLTRMEAGLRLFSDQTGIEYPIDAGHGRIDILALDIESAPVVIEIKKLRGRRGALGQLLYYMGWIDRYLGRGRSRGVIVAAHMTAELMLAAERAPGVSLFKYRYDGELTVEPVTPTDSRQSEEPR